jgi:hypothetical protein
MIWGKIFDCLNFFAVRFLATYCNYMAQISYFTHFKGTLSRNQGKDSVINTYIFFCNTVGRSLTAIKKALEYDTYKLTVEPVVFQYSSVTFR